MLERRLTESGEVTLTHQGYKLRYPERGVSDLTSYITDDDTLFIVTHMSLASIRPETWRLHIRGLVGAERTFSLADIEQFPQHEIMSVHECAGSPLTPKEPKRRVGNVIWRGARLCDVLARCDILPEAAFVWTEGLEWGEFAGLKDEPFLKDLPLSKALSPETLLAVSMNGEPLTPERGGPVRLVVPGWYGTNSVKWIGRISAAHTRSPGPYTTQFYNDVTENGTKPVWGIAPESVIVSPADRSTLPAGEALSIWGWAWAENGVSGVEVSIDGQTWMTATLETREGFGWQQFSASVVLTPGKQTLSCRCFDSAGTGQPETLARNAIHTIEVEVKA
ncbi:oxidoreductase molybdopterin binding domain protein [Burkholderia cepacia]|jgi:DMSO/TMAO reductase YedYZ molybdopterin-dependent catalytic subunit|nr:molybdopterin-dependent oxidoreductase [Burkholderia cenocepacia]AIO43863.1 oxidoreductase molybdopterin binding domain protein [Burkholderia cepacia]KGC05221.1 oxidoreductase molybdopterin binding domain protein [Burkholderia cepacia]